MVSERLNRLFGKQTQESQLHGHRVRRVLFVPVSKLRKTESVTVSNGDKKLVILCDVMQVTDLCRNQTELLMYYIVHRTLLHASTHHPSNTEHWSWKTCCIFKIPSSIFLPFSSCNLAMFRLSAWSRAALRPTSLFAVNKTEEWVVNFYYFYFFFKSSSTPTDHNSNVVSEQLESDPMMNEPSEILSRPHFKNNKNKYVGQKSFNRYKGITCPWKDWTNEETWIKNNS